MVMFAGAADYDEGEVEGLAPFLLRQLTRLIGFALVTVVLGAVLALCSWHVDDPSFSYAIDGTPKNWLGFPGSAFADLSLQFVGLAILPLLVPILTLGCRLAMRVRLPRWRLRLPAATLALPITAAAFALLPEPEGWPLPSGLGGLIGDALLTLPMAVIDASAHWWMPFALGAVLFPAAIMIVWFAGGLSALSIRINRPVLAEVEEDVGDDDEDDEDREGWFSSFYGWLVHSWLSWRAVLRRRLGLSKKRKADARTSSPFMERLRNDPDFDPDGSNYDGEGHPEDGTAQPDRSEARTAETDEDDDDSAELGQVGASDRIVPFKPRLVHSNDDSRAARSASARPSVERVAADTADIFDMPDLDFLTEPPAIIEDRSLSEEALEENARQLEGVLDDFGVRGEIIQVRPGPVVTLYELEPAPGIKSSRVIGLAEDIARSMSAISARVAVVPGRNAIGIELPNEKRQTVYLRELLASDDFKKTKTKLALSLGKTINGEGVIADLAKMPHLLVAGTTGSGKSVAINTMILSLLYRMTPDQCRLIMIDPKMLELSVYDGIPHLLSPVVTDPKKAVVALKWTVREMEDRYRKMSKVGVRNIDGFNQRVREATQKGETITRTVQTGFDRETGEAIYESEDLNLEPMPYIVVIIDEMADLMMVAGKEIEGAVQRLAQMARAAGIHVIMATQRPSVDVITGTIKANFPTRISFQVTSKIDSRTILGEQGAEQLLGMGDMLYMAGGGKTQRVHGPFVSDGEVEQVVAYLKLQGVPDYLDAVTEDDDEDGEAADGGGAGYGGGGDDPDSDDPYDQAVAVVLRDGKASTSYIQRRLGIGYNRAATLIERMEDEGVIGPANHAGKREILVPTEEETY